MDNREIESLMSLALEGDKDAGRQFYTALLQTTLFVPDRAQNFPLTESPEYPTDLVHVLGIQDKDRVVVPAFLQPEHVREWFKNELNVSEMSCERLLRSIPDGWWLVINPGLDVEKECSPWEIERLREGPQAIEEVLEEAFATEPIEMLDVRPLDESIYPTLIAKLQEYGQAHAWVRALYVLEEQGRDVEGQVISTILIGAHVDLTQLQNFESIRDEIQNIAHHELIGNSRARVVVGDTVEHHVSLGVFHGMTPLYSGKNEPGLLSKLASLFK